MMELHGPVPHYAEDLHASMGRFLSSGSTLRSFPLDLGFTLEARNPQPRCPCALLAWEEVAMVHRWHGQGGRRRIDVWLEVYCCLFAACFVTVHVLTFVEKAGQQ